VNCVNGFSWCGNTSGRGYCFDECRGDRKLADETRRIDVALKEYDRLTTDKPEPCPCWYCEGPSVERRKTRKMDSPGFYVDVCEECADSLHRGDELDRRERLRDGRDE